MHFVTGANECWDNLNQVIAITNILPSVTFQPLQPWVRPALLQWLYPTQMIGLYNEAWHTICKTITLLLIVSLPAWITLLIALLVKQRTVSIRVFWTKTKDKLLCVVESLHGIRVCGCRLINGYKMNYRNTKIQKLNGGGFLLSIFNYLCLAQKSAGGWSGLTDGKIPLLIPLFLVSSLKRLTSDCCCLRCLREFSNTGKVFLNARQILDERSSL